PGETFLQKKNRFYRGPRVASQERVEKIPIEGFRRDVGSTGAPPIRRRFAMMKSDATEKPRVAKNERAFRLLENEVVVFLGSKAGWFDAQFPSHSEMDPDPVASGKFEEHLFSPGLRTEKACAGQLADERPRVRSAKDALPRMELHANDRGAEPDVPLPAEKFYFGELRHDGRTLCPDLLRVLGSLDGEGDHRRQRMRGTNGRDLCGPR